MVRVCYLLEATITVNGAHGLVGSIWVVLDWMTCLAASSANQRRPPYQGSCSWLAGWGLTQGVPLAISPLSLSARHELSGRTCLRTVRRFQNPIYVVSYLFRKWRTVHICNSKLERNFQSTKMSI